MAKTPPQGWWRSGSASEPEGAWVGQGCLHCIASSSHLLPCSLSKGELYFMSTGVPSATAARGVIYKVIDPSR